MLNGKFSAEAGNIWLEDADDALLAVRGCQRAKQQPGQQGQRDTETAAKAPAQQLDHLATEPCEPPKL